jgi:membrane protein
MEEPEKLEQTEKEKERRSMFDRYTLARTVFVSWLTDPAVLVYRREAHGRRRARVMMVEFFLFVREIAREFYVIEGTSRAASLAYTTLLSLIPLLVAFSVTLRQYFSDLFPNMGTQIDNVLNTIVPYQSPTVAYHIKSFFDAATKASAVGLIIFMVVAFRLFLAVEGTVNQIWRVRSVRGYRPKIMAFTMLFFWGPVLMALSLTTTSMLEKNRYLKFLVLNEFIFALVPIVVLMVGFTMLFWLVPSTHVRFTAAALGALVTTVLFSAVRFAFGLYANHLVHGNFNYIYGTLGLAIIFLVAIETMWVIILLGVEISYVYQNLYGLLRATEQQISDEPRFDLYFALRAIVEVSRRFDRREDAPSSYRLAEQFGTTDAQMMRVLRKLEDVQLVKEIGGDWTGFAPGCDPDRITVEEVVTLMEGQRAMPETTPADRERQKMAELFDRLNDATKNALNRMTIGQLVRELYAPRVPSRLEDRFTGR